MPFLILFLISLAIQAQDSDATCEPFRHTSSKQVSQKYEKCKSKKWTYILEEKQIRVAEYKISPTKNIQVVLDKVRGPTSFISSMPAKKENYTVKLYNKKQKPEVEVFRISESTLEDCIKKEKAILSPKGCE